MPNLPRGQQQTVADSIHAHVVADGGQIPRALADQRANEVLRHAAQPKSADHNRGAVKHIANGLIRTGYNFVHSEEDSK